MTRPDDVWIVIAAFGEATRLSGTLARLRSEGWTNAVVVDDGSPDRTSETALAHPVWLLRHVLNLGQGAALQTGIEFALSRGARWIVTFDADGQHDPAEIERLLEPLWNGTVDAALGSRFLGKAENMPATRRLVLKAGVVFTRLFSAIRVTDVHNGFRAFTAEAARELDITQNRMAHASEILDRIRERRWRFVEVPVTIRYTEQTLAKGQSSWNAVRIALQLLLRRMVR